MAAVCAQLEKLGDPLDRSATRDLVARAELEMGRVRDVLRDALGGAQVP